MNRKALKTVKKYNMLQQGDAVVVALSGGADSVALLHFLYTLSSSYALSLTACHVNHHLRGEESVRDENFVKEWCASLNVPLRILSIDAALEAQKRKKSVEEVSRELRYRFFEETAAPLHAKIATAHTLSDNMETVLFYMTRGTGLPGLCGIPPVRNQGALTVIRPLIDCSRREIETYCEENSLRFVTDSTNLSDDYTRNRIRHRIVPELENINPAFPEVFARMLENLRRDEQHLLLETEEELKKRLLDDGALRLNGFSKLPESLKNRVILRWFSRFKTDCDAHRLSLLLGCLEKGQGAVQLQKNVVVRADGGFAWIRMPQRQDEILLEEGVFSLEAGKSLLVRRLDGEQVKKYLSNDQNLLKNCVDCDKIVGNAIVRLKNASDRLTLPKRPPDRLLKKLCNDLSVPIYQREQMIVAEDEKGVFWASTLGADVRVRPDSLTQKAFRIAVKFDL